MQKISLFDRFYKKGNFTIAPLQLIHNYTYRNENYDSTISACDSFPCLLFMLWTSAMQWLSDR